MTTKKDRRHDGYVTPRATIPKKLLIKYHLFIDEFYDDWQDYRDSMRNWFGDFKKIKRIPVKQTRYTDNETVLKRLQMNKKQMRLAKRRKMMKIRRRC